MTRRLTGPRCAHFHRMGESPGNGTISGVLGRRPVGWFISSTAWATRPLWSAARKHKGVGITSEEGGKLFFQQSSLEGTAIKVLQVRTAVTYGEERGPKGPWAEKVRPQ